LSHTFVNYFSFFHAVNPPIDAVLELDILNDLISFMDDNEHPELQLEAAWTITNLCSGNYEQTQFIIEAGVIPHLIPLLSSPNAEVKAQSIWALANISGDCQQNRDLVIEAGGLTHFLEMGNSFNESSDIALVRNLSWALSNIFRYKPQPDLETVVRPALPLVNRFLHWNDEQVVAEAGWALSYACDGPDERILAVLAVEGLSARIVECLSHPSLTVVTPALRTFGNFVTGDAAITDTALALNPLPALKVLLDSTAATIRKETCWTFSNIAAGTPEQIQQLFDHDIFPKLIELTKGPSVDVQTEAVWAVINPSEGGTVDQNWQLIQMGMLPPLIDILTVTGSTPKVRACIIEGVCNLTTKFESEGKLNQFREKVLENNGRAAIVRYMAGNAISESTLEKLNELLSGTNE
jgi:importin subunit alpha-1